VPFVRGSVRGSRRRALAFLPSLFTLANMFCGFLAILLSIRGEFRLAAVLIGFSIIFDITDGAVARLVGAITPFGLQFDSLADLVSFGLAPALLVFTLPALVTTHFGGLAVRQGVSGAVVPVCVAWTLPVLYLIQSMLAWGLT